ncbi:mono-functional DNA-alkylating methyl methanesulfonate N-term-domain-containing protein [Podospora fimiseda]|uniref:Mono-functional DNA-alkylating methyl methanesulfonate N-term-domain-containing protein n=1 Tax=Podospora fimiseda TaxID=252190 RepID=A0AAN7H3P1_9PEZI|nr:mono-functional DNA-alkylating methyl methanesulfonate N-term-domain-containing protein [Podospora fimiseda]
MANPNGSVIFNTTVFRDGSWVNERVTLQSVLKAHAASNQIRPAIEPAPRFGLLTKTVIESSKANQILPVNLRSPQHDDVAFIGDHSVQICQLRTDGRLKEVIRKTDFPCRIRSACVIGASRSKTGDEAQVDTLTPIIKPDPGLPFSATQSQLPPQLLMLVLENGDSVFLFVRTGSDGKNEFIAEHFQNPRASSPDLGFHVAVDPSSRYIVLTNPEESFVVYELESREALEHRYARGEPLRPVKSIRNRRIQGVIQNATFLYPRAGDDHHIILLLIIVNNNQSHIVIYQWDLGNDLEGVFAEVKSGHRIIPEAQMPLLLIPLTVDSAFLAVSADHIWVCTQCLYGPPTFEAMIDIPLEKSARPRHHGLGAPLWTSWTRPPRLKSFLAKRDSIFLAREDGVVIYIEAESDCIPTRCTLVKTFDTSISACASINEQHADVLILGSDSGPGSVWRAPARKPIEPLGILPNWSPAVDFTTTYHADTTEKFNKTGLPVQLRKPDRIFATCQSGKMGSITEYRYGKKASIGLSIEAMPGMRDSWMFPSRGSFSPHGYSLLLSEPGGSAILSLTPDLAVVEPLAAESVPYDLDSPTLVFKDSDSLSVQVTTGSVVLIRGDTSARYVHSGFPCLHEATIMDACVMDECVAVSAHIESVFSIYIFKIDQTKLTLSHVRTINAGAEVTCVSINSNFTLLVGLWDGSQPLIGSCSLEHTSNELAAEPLPKLLAIEQPNDYPTGLPDIESIGSIVSTQGRVLVGTKSGELFTLVKDHSTHSRFKVVNYEKFGTTPAILTCHQIKSMADPILLLTCDTNLVSIEIDHKGQPRTKSRVWPVDYENLGAPPLPVLRARVVDTPSEAGQAQILMISGSNLVLAELDDAPGPVQRSIELKSAPNKIIYSHFLRCLVVAVLKDDKPSLLFIDPNTGEDLSKPVSSKNQPVEFISGLGKERDRILCLNEWRFIKEGKIFYYLVVGTRNGNLLVIYSQRESDQTLEGPTRIRYWTKWKKDYSEPVYSVLGYDEGLVFCTGLTLRWGRVDEFERRLKSQKSHDLESPATSLKISGDKLLAMTSKDSLIVVDHIRAENPGTPEKTTVHNVDPQRHRGGHFIETQRTDGGSIVLISDIECNVGAFWIPWQTPDADVEMALRASLRASVRKFQVANVRPLWDHPETFSSNNRFTTDHVGDILGISLNGSLHSFTYLTINTWRFLRFIQNLIATDDPETYELYRSPLTSDLEPRQGKGLEMQVDGDILERFLIKGELEKLVSKRQSMTRFMELLEKIDNGEHTQGLSPENDGEKYLTLGYDILEYYLRPVL